MKKYIKSTTVTAASLYDRLKTAVGDSNLIDTHESDIYVAVTPETTKIIQQYYNDMGIKSQATKFKDEVTGKPFYDVPFAYMNELVEKRRPGGINSAFAASKSKKPVTASTTTDISDFGYVEREALIELLTSWNNDGLPEDFYEDGVHFMFNQNSGYVFLTNSEYQVAMINPNTGRLESFYTTPYAGHEGFLDELVDEYNEDPDSWDVEDIEYLQEIGGIVSGEE